MKIAITIKSSSKESLVSDVFGRANFIYLVEPESGNEEIIANPFAATYGGAGIQTAQLLIENNVDVVITGNIGGSAFRMLESVSIKVYKTGSESLSTTIALELLNGNKLCLLKNEPGNGERYRMRKRSVKGNKRINNQ